MTQLIDLGKLRFHFAGDWNGSTTYESNDIVKYGGNVYVYTYGLKTSGHLPTDTVYWALMIEGFKFKGVFDTTTQYRVGDGVAHGGKVYVAVLDSTNQTPPNTTYWSQFADGIQYEGAYAAITPYQKNDVVTYGGSVYIAKVDTTGNDPTNTVFWNRFVDGISPKSIYNNATAYAPNDLVAYGSNIYRAIQNTTGHLPTNTTFWTPFLYGFANRGEWSSGASYLIGEIVTYGGSMYQAKADNNAINPATTSATWDKLTYGFKNKGEWSTATQYVTDDVVSHGGNTYIALLPHASAGFEADLASNKWQRFNSGIRWRGGWSATTLYLKDDIVRDAVGSVYVANLDHTSTIDFATDKTGGKWTLFAAGGADVLPPIQTGDAGQSLTVKSDGSGIDWIGATQSDKVFYVAPHGVDSVNHGKNVTTPFASIKYATQQCGEGATIFVKTGTYSEQLPITVPANVAIVGDNQRTTIVQPIAGNSDDGTTPNAQSSMFLMSNGSILNKMTFKGMTGWVPGTTASDVTSSIIKGVVVRLNPASPITHKSPYVLECAFIGSGAIGALIDGSVHSSGAKTMIFHGYTVISDNGVGYWVKDGGKAEIVSCFTYYAYFGYTASGGGFIRALNGNNSYGTWGATARGFDNGETPITGNIVGEQLPFVYTGGLINVGDTVSNGAGATATVTNVQYSANKVYIKNRSGTFSASQNLTFTSGGTGTCSSGAESQRGFVLVANGFGALPKPGASISLAGDTYSYVIQSVTNTWVDSSSDLVLLLSQEKPSGSASGTGVTIRYKYSQIRLTGHDFLSIGTGGVATTNYPGTPTQAAAQGNETDETFPGRVFYVSTDQDGNFRVGEYFRIDQATGRATLNASAFDLSGLSSLRLGSIGAQLGEQINEFSSDNTMSGNSNTAVPTEYAVKAYVDSKVSASIPSQAGNSGKLLGTDGTNISWVEGLPVQTDKNGYYLRSNGTSSYWDSMTQITGTTSFTVQTGQAFASSTYSVSSLVTASPSWTWSLVGAPSNLSINSSGVLSQTSNFASGTYSFKVQATDGKFEAKIPVTIFADPNVPLFSNASPPSLIVPGSGALSFSFAQATTPTGSPTHTLAAGSSLPSWLTLNSDGTITGTAPSTALTTTAYGFTVVATRGGISASKTYTWSVQVTYPVGQALFGTNVGAGTFSWTAPAGVTSVSVVCVGGGHGGSSQWSYGGGAGGGLGYKNNITVVPGQTYTVVVGAGGTKQYLPNYYNADNGYSSFQGGDSYFINKSTVGGQGGGRPNDGSFGNRYIANDYGYSGGGYTGDGGGRGGNISTSWTCPGAGVGGYYGRGGCNDQGRDSTYGGAMGDYYSSTYGTGGGGGIGLTGDQGSDRYGQYCYTPWTSYYSRNGSYGGGGGHGPGGNNGAVGENQWSSPWPYGYGDIRGGDYGGGGGGSGSSNGGGPGGQGGVRIIWGTISGSQRAFPNTYATDQTVVG